MTAIQNDWKLMVKAEYQSAWLLERPDGVEAARDVGLGRSVRTDAMNALLAEAFRPKAYWLQAGEAELDPELEESMRALGYLN